MIVWFYELIQAHKGRPFHKSLPMKVLPEVNGWVMWTVVKTLPLRHEMLKRQMNDAIVATWLDLSIVVHNYLFWFAA
jgi:hypothetical protein